MRNLQKYGILLLAALCLCSGCKKAGEDAEPLPTGQGASAQTVPENPGADGKEGAPKDQGTSGTGGAEGALGNEETPGSGEVSGAAGITDGGELPGTPDGEGLSGSAGTPDDEGLSGNLGAADGEGLSGDPGTPGDQGTPGNPNVPAFDPSQVKECEPRELVTTARVNVRTLPSLEGEILTLLQPGVAVTCTGSIGDWYQVDYEGRTAYMFAEYLGERAAVPSPKPSEAGDSSDGDIKDGIFYETDASAAWIVIDAGHQEKGNYNKEPVGPGATETKAKVSSGTEGRFSGMAEYELNLAVALKLRDALIDQGYNVVMIRETNKIDISNAERAEIANKIGADAFVRVHANGSENTSVQGMMTICQTKNNRYCGGLYEESR